MTAVRAASFAKKLGMLPPGDIRNCLVALSDDYSGLLGPLFQYRFPEGEGLAGHALGNLIIAALADLTGSFPAAIEAAEHYLHARGHVYPSTLVDVELHGVDRAGGHLSGQARLAVSDEPARVRASRARVARRLPAGARGDLLGGRDRHRAGVALHQPHPELCSSMASPRRSATSHALRIYVCNVANMRGETGGLDAADHVAALAEHGLAGAVDLVLVHEPCADASAVCDDVDGVEPVPAGDDVRRPDRGPRPRRHRRGSRRPDRPGPSFACGALPHPREGGRVVSFTAEVKDELSRIEPKRACCLKAELAALVRIEGTLHISGPDRYRLEVATETAPVARTVIKLLHGVYGLKTELTVRRSVLHKTNNYLITVPTQPKLSVALNELGILGESGFSLGIDPKLDEARLLRDRVPARSVPRRRLRRRPARRLPLRAHRRDRAARRRPRRADGTVRDSRRASPSVAARSPSTSRAPSRS